MRKVKLFTWAALAGILGSGMVLSGCGASEKDNEKTKIEMVQYKPEAVKAFEKMEEKFNASHDDIELVIESPNEAMTVLKTRFIKEDQPDIIGIGGDINYSNFLDADMLMDISDLRDWQISSRHIWTLTKIWNLFQRMEYMQFLMPQMPQVFFITRICLKKMDGRSLKPGMSFLNFLIPFRHPDSSRFILDLRMSGPVWRPGMQWPVIWLPQMCASR